MEIAKARDLCSGCGACGNICPVNAINMINDKKGFLYPKVNKLVCINCGMCKQVCPTNNETNVKKSVNDFYAVQIKDKKKRMESQSGGAFTAFSEVILYKGGVVYGVSLDNELQVVYIRVDNLNSLKKLKGSKYVQARMGNIHKEVAGDLKSGINVLFSGTACHVEGLISYLNERHINKDNLLTCDLICHGTNSPRMFNDYLEFISKKYDFDKSKGINFRDKAKGWHNHVESFYNLEGKKFFLYGYANLFYTNLGLRESCYSCQYANLNRISDITIGDFWGVERIKPEYDDNTGVSVVMVNSKKALKYFELISSLDFFKINLEDCIQHNMKRPTIKPQNTKKFWDEYNSKGFSYILKKYGKSPLNKVIIRKIIQILDLIGIKEVVKKHMIRE